MKRTFENPLIGDTVHFTKFAHEPGGSATIIDVELKPGGGNGLHFHKTMAEQFECLEGIVSIQVGKLVRQLKPGETATAPAGSLHRFFNASAEPAKFRVTIDPGHVGFEHTLKIAYGLAADGLMTKSGMPKKLWHMGTLIRLSDTNVPGLFSLLQRPMAWLAQRALDDGRYEKELKPYTD
ncbi:cupin domain-containing protein [Larkinella bovis]|uniref:Cupin domain-containing protein n=1 Tax=Larkinella bovis TaxID=683041 RepID=A0ABW0I7L2_9BACT